MALNLKIGADPEVFVKQGGKFVSAHGLVKGTKQKPFPVPLGAVQVDGMALEFNIEPATNEHSFVHNITNVMQSLKEMVPTHQLVIQPTAIFDKATWDAVPTSAKELGCDPDYNAYTGVENVRPDGEVDFRTAAGHIHIGWTEGVDPHDPGHMQDCIAVVKQLDNALGTWSLLWDKDTKRRMLYGKAGAFRPKSYGVEYRTLSNMWLSDPRLIKWIFTQTTYAVKSLYEGLEFATNRLPNWAQHIIDTDEGINWWRKSNGSCRSNGLLDLVAKIEVEKKAKKAA